MRFLPGSSSGGAEPLALELLGLERGRELSPEPCNTLQMRGVHPPALPRVGSVEVTGCGGSGGSHQCMGDVTAPFQSRTLGFRLQLLWGLLM